MFAALLAAFFFYVIVCVCMCVCVNVLHSLMTMKAFKHMAECANEFGSFRVDLVIFHLMSHELFYKEFFFLQNFNFNLHSKSQSQCPTYEKQTCVFVHVFDAKSFDI